MEIGSLDDMYTSKFYKKKHYVAVNIHFVIKNNDWQVIDQNKILETFKTIDYTQLFSALNKNISFQYKNNII